MNLLKFVVLFVFINIVLPAQTASYRMVVQTFTLADTPLPTQTFRLLNEPIRGTRERIIVLFRSSQADSDIDYAVPPGLGKNLEVTVPEYRPFTLKDVLTIIYWTLDP